VPRKGAEGSKWNWHADLHRRRNESLYKGARLLSWRGAPAGPRGQAWLSRPPSGPGPESPAHLPTAHREGGACPLAGRGPGPATCERGPRAPRARPELKGGIRRSNSHPICLGRCVAVVILFGRTSTYCAIQTRFNRGWVEMRRHFSAPRRNKRGDEVGEVRHSSQCRAPDSWGCLGW
jgi:hypothetical protein